MAEPTTLDVTIPLDVQGMPIRGILKAPNRPPRVLYFSPASLARVLQDVQLEETDLGAWWDLLGATGFAAKRTGQREEIIMTSPGGVRDIRYGAYHGDNQEGRLYKSYKVHMHPLVWILTFASGKLQSGRLYCAERLLHALDEDARLTPFPYGHGNEGNGLICWGSTAINHITPKDPRLAERVFFGSGTNDHLFMARWLGATLGTWLKAHQSEADLATPIPLSWRDVRAVTLQQALGRYAAET